MSEPRRCLNCGDPIEVGRGGEFCSESCFHEYHEQQSEKIGGTD